MSDLAGVTGEVKYEYRCDAPDYQHYIGSPKELTLCRAYVNGEPCEGNLKRIGEGSRKANASVSDA